MKLFYLETERLRLIPLPHSQLINYLKADGSLEEQLGVHFLKRRIEPELIEAFEKVILPTVGNPSKNFLFSTLWTLVAKDKNVMVGDICFKGEPDQNGELEIAYCTYTQFQNKGYMSEAVKTLCLWALEQSGVSGIKASTDVNNAASTRLLEKVGFVPAYELARKQFWSFSKSVPVTAERA
jgi:RimJ/RimL family protein N-acetyltransferase